MSSRDIVRAGVPVVAVLLGVAVATGLALPLLVLVTVLGLVVASLRRPILGLAAAVSLMPLEAVGRVVRGSSSLTYAKLALMLAVGLALVSLMMEGRKLATPPGAWALYAFAGCVLASTAWAGTFFGAGSAMSALAIVAQVALVFIVTALVRTEGDLDILLSGIVIGSIPVVLVGVIETFIRRSLFGTVSLQYYADPLSGAMRVTSTFWDPNALGRYMVFAAVFTVMALVLPRFARARPLLLVLIVGQVFVLTSTYSRGAAVAALLGALLLTPVVGGGWRRSALALVLTLVVVLSLLMFTDVFDPLGARFGMTGGADPTGGRARIFLAGWQAFLDRPLLGYGPAGVTSAIAEVAGVATSPHSLYLETILAMGVIGGLLLLWILASCGIEAVREWSSSVYVRLSALSLLLVLVVGAALQGLDANEMWLSIAFLLAAVGIASRNRSRGAVALTTAEGRQEP